MLGVYRPVKSPSFVTRCGVCTWFSPGVLLRGRALAPAARRVEVTLPGGQSRFESRYCVSHSLTRMTRGPAEAFAAISLTQRVQES